ncbi:MAG: hypothetical protein A2078_06960 [Nitrospirae bacterium GWC2_57_9]|nr:MAG: hypothetical protein A2078_06960 [Nitrospirae bacterium GWC2_57_9]
MEAASELDLKQVLRLVYKKKVLYLSVAAAVTSVILVVGYLMPKTYEATSVIFIERNVLNELIKNVTVTSSIEEKVKALSVVIKSRSLIMKVMDDLDMDVTGRSAEQLEGAIRGFQKETEIKIEMNRSQRDMDLFTVSFRNSDPQLASNYVNLLVRRYIEENLSHKREEAYGASRFLLDQISTFKGKLEKIEASMSRLRREKNIPEKGSSAGERLQQLLRRKDELLVLYTENHPEVMRIRSEIETLRERVKNEPVESAGSDAVMLDLERERETTKKIYEDLLATLRRSEVSTQIEVQDKAGAFRIIDPAVVPTRPISPNMVQMVVLAIVGGLAIASVLLVLVDRFDVSVKSVDILKKMGLPVLAVISTMRTDQETAAIKKKDRIVYAVAGFYLACLLLIAGLESMGYSFIDEFVQAAKVEVNHTLKKL